MIFLPSFRACNSQYFALLPHTHLFSVVSVSSISLNWCLQRKVWGWRTRGEREGKCPSLLEEHHAQPCPCSCTTCPHVYLLWGSLPPSLPHCTPEPSPSTSQDGLWVLPWNAGESTAWSLYFPKTHPWHPRYTWLMGLHLGRGIAWEGFLLYSLSPHPPSYLAVKLLEGVAKLKLNVCYIKSGGKKNLRKKKIIIYIYKKLNHFAVHLKLTQNCKSTIIKKKK